MRKQNANKEITVITHNISLWPKWVICGI
jgi:hypothetical protein